MNNIRFSRGLVNQLDPPNNQGAFVNGDATFNDTTRNAGGVTGTATFNNSACNEATGTAGIFIPNPPPSC